MANRLLKQFEQKPLDETQRNSIAQIRDQFIELAQWLDMHLPENADKTVALRKLREAKDCAVISEIYPEG